MGDGFRVISRHFWSGANGLAILAGAAFLLFPAAAWAGDAFGVAYIALVTVNSFLAAYDEGRRRLAMAGLAFSAVGSFLLPPLLMARASMDYPSPAIAAAGHAIVFGALVLGALRAWPAGTAAGGRNGAGGRGQGAPDGKKRPFSLALWAAIGLFLLLLLLLAAITLTGPEGGILGMTMPPLFPYFALGVVPLGGIASRLARKSGYIRGYMGQNALFMLANATALFALTPLTEVPGVVARAAQDFRDVYRADAESFALPGMRPAPFALGEMFLGSRPGRAVAELDQVYLRDRGADGKERVFRYDRWMPAEGGDAHLPVLLRVHGGAWISGDKGAWNMGGMNRYFASRGYAVFDLQYGLNDAARFPFRSPTPSDTVGPYGLDDMLRHIGAFTALLADRADELGIDPARVFVSGASAGGQLAIAAVLAQTSGYSKAHPGVGVDPRLRVAGIIPFYPGIGLAAGIGVPGAPELDDPSRLLGAANPPMLVFQGLADGLVRADAVRDFVRAYDYWGGDNAMMIEFPSAGHAADMNFWGCYNQVFLYYMERFMRMEATRPPAAD